MKARKTYLSWDIIPPDDEEGVKFVKENKEGKTK